MTVHFCIGLISRRGFTSELWAYLAFTTQVVKQAAQLVISSFVGTEVVEASQLVKWRDRAAVVAGDTVLGVANEKGEMVGSEEVTRDDGRIVRLSLRFVRVGRAI